MIPALVLSLFNPADVIDNHGPLSVPHGSQPQNLLHHSILCSHHNPPERA